MSAAPQQSDQAVARVLGTLGLLMVGGWGVVALVAASIRTYDDMAARHAMLQGRDWSALLPLPLALALSTLWMFAFLGAGLGLALGAAGLGVAGRPRTAVTLFAVVTVCVVADYVFGVLRSERAWQYHPDPVVVATTAATFAAPLAGLVATVALLVPVLRTPRSTPAPAAAG